MTAANRSTLLTILILATFPLVALLSNLFPSQGGTVIGAFSAHLPDYLAIVERAETAAARSSVECRSISRKVVTVDLTRVLGQRNLTVNPLFLDSPASLRPTDPSDVGVIAVLETTFERRGKYRDSGVGAFRQRVQVKMLSVSTGQVVGRRITPSQLTVGQGTFWGTEPPQTISDRQQHSKSGVWPRDDIFHLIRLCEGT